MRLFKRFFLFAAELVFLFFGFMFSMGFAVYLGSLGYKFAPVAFLLGFSVICVVLVWFRRKTGKWTIAADATAWLTHRSWRLLHPRRAKYLHILQCSFLWFPSVCSALALFFLPSPCSAMRGEEFREFPLRRLGELRMNRFYFREHSNRI